MQTSLAPSEDAVRQAYTSFQQPHETTQNHCDGSPLAKSNKYVSLPFHSLLNLAVPLVPEADPGILGREAKERQIAADFLFDVFPRLVERGNHTGTHLLVIPQCEIVDRCRVWAALLRVRSECFASCLLARGGVGTGWIVDTVPVEEVEKNSDIFEPRVHALAVERYHGVSGVSEYDRAGLVMVWTAFDGYQGQMGVFAELLQ